MKTLSSLLTLIVIVCSIRLGDDTVLAAEAKRYEPTWKSLKQHTVPEWYLDAKFGIYAHWGVYTVPGYNSEWYPKRMYVKNSPVHQYHKDTYGDSSRFGYKDFIPMFKAEKFDAEQWAELYHAAGAKFAGPVAEHHDGFSMWASTINRWNAAEMGPKRDVVGELVSALRKRGIKIITSFHHANNIMGWYPKVEGTDSADLQYGDLYGKFSDSDQGLDRWFAKVKEVIDQYQPDQLWFDIGLARIPDEYKRKVVQYYYNKAVEWNKEVLITKKNNDLPDGVAVLDIERGKMETKADFVWQTDDSIAVNSWGWIQGLDVKPAEELVFHLIDIVSKNGILMLNICPKADGSIPDDQKKILLQIGDWLNVNGEAIYGTRSWITHGEGPHLFSEGGTNVRSKRSYTNEDIRFTRKGDVLYAIVLGWPKEQLTLQSLLIENATPDSRITLLGRESPLNYQVDANRQLVIEVPRLSPDQRPCQFAYAFRLNGFKVAYHPDAVFADGRPIILKPDCAVLEGGHQGFKINKQGKTQEFIRFLNNSKGRVNWLVEISKPGRYAIRGRFAPFNSPDRMAVEIGGSAFQVSLPKTNSWQDPATLDVGEVEFQHPGVYRLVLHTDNPNQLRRQTMAVWDVQLAPVD